MAFVFGLAGWLAGIALSCLLQCFLVGHKLPDSSVEFFFDATYYIPPILCVASFACAFCWGHWKRVRLEWPVGLGGALVLAAIAAFSLQSWRFWGFVAPHASIRPMGYGIFMIATSAGIFLFGLLVSVTDIAQPRQPRWIGIALGAAGIVLSLLPFWSDQAIMQHFEHIHHFVFED